MTAAEIGPQLLKHVAAVALAIAVVVVLSRQCRKPTWWPGRLFVSMMNMNHSSLTDWGLGQVVLEKQFTMLDVGCGGGKTIDKLATIASEGMVYGIDYSAVSVDVARRTNKRWIEMGHADVRQGSVSHLPFPDDTFDVVSAVETHYYWPNLVEDMREIRRVLKPGGRLVVIAETYSGRRFDALYRPAMRLLRAAYLSVSEHRESLWAAGFCETVVSEERGKGWICAVGRKPVETAAQCG
jgi:SAM-dependent methyltransferase